jgi:hypothetical protein
MATAPYDEKAIWRTRSARRSRGAHGTSGRCERQTSPAKRTLAGHINAALHDEFLRRGG